MKTIILFGVPLGLVALVDDEDFERINNYHWRVNEYGGMAIKKYRAQTQIYKSPGKNKKIKMHRMVLGLTDPNIKVDHIDGNGLNNQKSNLRICTMAQNGCNMLKPNNNTSGYKGVYFRKDGRPKPWFAAIMVNYKSIRIGSYLTKEEAALAYNEAAKKYHGEFARVNKL